MTIEERGIALTPNSTFVNNDGSLLQKGINDLNELRESPKILMKWTSWSGNLDYFCYASCSSSPLPLFSF